eukprot:1708078-Ditylum_brightwellii.AAC.1
MVIPSQSKQERGAGKKEPTIHDLCDEIRRDAAGSSSHYGRDILLQTGEQPLGKRGSPVLSRM